MKSCNFPSIHQLLRQRLRMRVHAPPSSCRRQQLPSVEPAPAPWTLFTPPSAAAVKPAPCAPARRLAAQLYKAQIAQLQRQVVLLQTELAARNRITREAEAALLRRRHALHSSHLAVRDEDGEGLSWEAPLARDMAAFAGEL